MKAIRFNLSGKFAHFKKPDVNSYAYFTYSHIHKVALLGMFGAILGLKGYENKNELPEFYKKLNHLKVAIIPKKPYFNKKIQTFNNSVGYASKEEGGNLIVKEQWLENPSWDIVVLDDESSEFNALKEKLFKSEATFIPYLGKNDFFANISDIKEIELQKCSSEVECISLVPKKEIDFIKPPRKGAIYYEELLPVGLKEYLIYEYEAMVLSNWVVRGEGLVEIDGKRIWCG